MKLSNLKTKCKSFESPNFQTLGTKLSVLFARMLLGVQKPSLTYHTPCLSSPDLWAKTLGDPKILSRQLLLWNPPVITDARAKTFWVFKNFFKNISYIEASPVITDTLGRKRLGIQQETNTFYEISYIEISLVIIDSWVKRLGNQKSFQDIF